MAPSLSLLVSSIHAAESPALHGLCVLLPWIARPWEALRVSVFRAHVASGGSFFWFFLQCWSTHACDLLLSPPSFVPSHVYVDAGFRLGTDILCV